MFRFQSIPLCSLLAGLALATASLGETVVLKSGEKIEGKILSETETQVTVETVSGGVVDERIIAKTDIASMNKVQPDAVAWQPLQALKPAESSFPTAEQYDTVIGSLRAFVTQHPTSSHKAEAEQALAGFEAEKKRVAAGELKLSGRWLSKDEVQRERYQVAGSVAANYMKTQVARGDLIGAMNSFATVEKQFEGSRGYLEAVDLARKVVPALQAQVAQRLAALPAENASRERGVKAAAGLEQIQLQKELDAEKKAHATALAEAKQRGQVWPPFLRRSDEGLKQLAKLCDETGKRLASLDVAKLAGSLKLAEEARTDLANKDFKAVESKLREAQQAWPKNEIAIRLGKELAAAKAAEAAAAAAPAATPAPVQATPTPTPTATPTPRPVATSAAAAPAEAVEEEGSTNWLFIAVATVLALIVGSVGWSAYRKVVKKSNEIIE